MKNKSILIPILTLAGIGLFGFIIWAFLLARAFSWSPPNTDLELTKNEKDWKKHAESAYKINIKNIGLDDSFMEDSIIYMNIKINSNSPQQTDLLDSSTLERFTRTLAIGFNRKSMGRDKQTCIHFRFYNLLYKESGEKYKHPISKRSRYHLKSGTTVLFE